VPAQLLFPLRLGPVFPRQLPVRVWPSDKPVTPQLNFMPRLLLSRRSLSSGARFLPRFFPRNLSCRPPFWPPRERLRWRKNSSAVPPQLLERGASRQLLPVRTPFIALILLWLIQPRESTPPLVDDFSSPIHVALQLVLLPPLSPLLQRNASSQRPFQQW
jgi:hypothetical protein